MSDDNGSLVNVGVELATAGVTSPGLETFLGLTNTEIATQTENGLIQQIAGLNYSNLKDRGYLEVTFTPNNATSHWVYVSSVKERDYSVLSSRENIAIISVGENSLG